jgi:membrane associated rhomboid family serine protease
MTPAVKAIIIANVAMFVITPMAPELVIGWLGLRPASVIGEARVWQVATYLFVHSPGSIGHVLMNMLMVWMFGVELERRWGTQAFTRYYFITGIGAGLCVVAASLLPMASADLTYYTPTIGASGAVYGVLLAWAMVFPDRPILFMLIFPMTARMFAILMGAIAFFSAASGSGSGISHTAHLGGLIIGYLYLKGPGNMRLNMKYHLTKWRMERMRRKFDVHKGGRDDWRDRIH